MNVSGKSAYTGTIYSKGNWTVGKGGQADFEHGAGKLPSETTLYLLKPRSGELKQATHQKGATAGDYYNTILCSNIYNMSTKPDPIKVQKGRNFVR